MKETQSEKGKQNSLKNGNTNHVQKKPAFGSPAIAFGSPAVGFGTPARGYGSPAHGYSSPSQLHGNMTQRYSTPVLAQGKHIQRQRTPVQANTSQTPGSGYGSQTPGYTSPYNQPCQSPLSNSSYNTSSPVHKQRNANRNTLRGYNHSSSSVGQYPSKSPQHQISFNYSLTPSPLTGRNNSFDSDNFKTPGQFSPCRGRGSVRKSFSAGHFSQVI